MFDTRQVATNVELEHWLGAWNVNAKSAIFQQLDQLRVNLLRGDVISNSSRNNSFLSSLKIRSNVIQYTCTCTCTSYMYIYMDMCIYIYMYMYMNAVAALTNYLCVV